MKNKRFFIKTNQTLMLILIFFVSVAISYSQAKQNSSKTKPQANKETNQANTLVNPQVELIDKLIKSTEDYKESLQKLALLYQTDVDKQKEKLSKKQELFKLGVVARRELEMTEEEIKNLQSKLIETQKGLEEAADLLVEAEAAKELAKLPPVTAQSAYRVTPGVIRYTGFSNWFLEDTPILQKFFQDSFKRALPISAYGQSSTHDRLGYDHRNSIDIAVHPETTEGRALIDFLRSKGIPFQAFNQAITGASTGPHIHIGKPSVRFH